MEYGVTAGASVWPEGQSNYAAELLEVKWRLNLMVFDHNRLLFGKVYPQLDSLFLSSLLLSSFFHRLGGTLLIQHGPSWQSSEQGETRRLKNTKPDAFCVAQNCNPSTWKHLQEDIELEAT